MPVGRVPGHVYGQTQASVMDGGLGAHSLTPDLYLLLEVNGFHARDAGVDVLFIVELRMW